MPTRHCCEVRRISASPDPDGAASSAGAATAGAASSGAAPRTAAQRERRGRIIEVATQLLVDRDYDRIQIRHVAESAGVALDTLYRYFPSKELLYAHVLVEWADSFPGAGGAARSLGSSDEERLRSVLLRAARAYERRPTFYRLITALSAVRDPAVAAVFQRFADAFDSTMRTALADTSERDAQVVATVAAAMLHTRLGAWSAGRSTMREVRADLDDAVRILFRGPQVATGPSS